MKLKKTVKGEVEFRLVSGNDLVKGTMPVENVAKIVEGEIAEDGPKGFEVRAGEYCFPRSIFTAR